ncbi:OmpH family outer membrane protein [Uliginosibacterium sp. H3]|uniref:OmpH family outer membrane protein n=1 Tax=Uliginosibacterium silvisoli TaxID=3114758 RepID=A0ABU6K3X5_9RHOO|nr:OmpH family outer membrane protein [Uliginosibacterium sp. H3]
MIPLLFCAVLATVAQAAVEPSRIGFVNADRVMRESAPALRVQKKIEKEFEKRDQELQRVAKQLQTMQDNLEKNSVTMAEPDRRARDREFNDLNRDFQRRRREYLEDRNQRQNEEMAGVLDRANRAIRQVAEAEKFDLIIQEAVYFNPRLDITDKVIKALTDTTAVSSSK